jgi:glycosyltransferase involved in cell wall biosynthesis
MNTKISIITVCYNAVDSLEETMLSVLNQTYLNVEYIVIDGGSKDGTVDIIKKYADRLSYWVSEPDKGIFDAMNKGLKYASGEWVNFMNSGDKFYNNQVLSDLSIQDLSSYDIIFGDAIYIRKEGLEKMKGMDVSYIERNMPNTHQAFFVKTSKAKQYGFDINYKYAADYKMIYTIFREHRKDSILYVPLTICIYEAITGFSMQASKEVQKEVFKIRHRTIDWSLCRIKFELLNLFKS